MSSDIVAFCQRQGCVAVWDVADRQLLLPFLCHSQRTALVALLKQRIDERKEQQAKAEVQQTKANDQKQTAQVAKTIPLEQFNKLETEDGKKIDHFAVFKMKSGNYGVRAMVDGQQMSVKALDKEDRNAFFEHTTTKAALVQKYYGKELSQPKQEERSRARAV